MSPRWFSALAFSLSLFFSVSLAHSAPDFKTSIILDYKYLPSGKSQVTQQVTLTNLTSQIYASSYQLYFQGELPKNLRAFDSAGNLKTSISTGSPESYLVNIEFNQPLVGRDQTRSFSVTYEGQPAVQKGQIWELNLPKISNPEFAQNYTFRLQTPSAFGQPAYISPPPSASSTLPGYNVFTYPAQALSQTGVVAAFGDLQVFNFTLNYSLQNTSSQNEQFEIALPPDTAYQKVSYSSISPLPQNVSADTDGNWLAVFDIPPSSPLSVTASGQVHILAQPDLHFPGNISPDFQPLLQSDDYWPVNDPRITSLSQTYRTPQDIYNYVVKTLSYDYSRLDSSSDRLGALGALDAPAAGLCREFTDLFITLARASGIPAREINGFAYTTDSRLKPTSLKLDTLHAWPEYWDQNSKNWISIDPTWGRTTGGIDYFHKFDFNHFAFVIHGRDSQYPVSAGLYDSVTASKDVSVEISAFTAFPEPSPRISWIAPRQLLPWSVFPASVTFSNPSGVALYNLPLKPNFTRLKSTGSLPETIPVLPPFSRLDYPLDLSFSPLTTFSAKSLSFTLGTQTVKYNVSVKSLSAWYVLVIIAASLGVVVIAAVTHHLWSLYFQRRLRRDSLRW